MYEFCGIIDKGKRIYFVDENTQSKIEKCEKCFFNGTMCKRVIIDEKNIFAYEKQCNLLK